MKAFVSTEAKTLILLAFVVAEFAGYTEIAGAVPRPCLSRYPPDDCLDTGGAFSNVFRLSDNDHFRLGVVLLWTPPIRAELNDAYFTAINAAIDGCKTGQHIAAARRNLHGLLAWKVADCIGANLTTRRPGCRLVTVVPGNPRGFSFSGYVFIKHVPETYRYVTRVPAYTVAVMPALEAS